MFIPESLKKEAIRRVRQDIESEIKKNLAIELSEVPINNPWTNATVKVTVTLKYKDEPVSFSELEI